MARVLVLLAATCAAWWLYERFRRQRARERIARVRADFLAVHDSDGADDQGLRDVEYRGGLVRFRVPQVWREEFGPDGGAAFFDPAGGQRTLRLHTISMTKEGAASPEGLAFLLGSLRPPSECALVTLPDGQLLLKYVDAGHEAGVDLVLYTWQLARSLSPDRARLAVFTLTVPAEAALDVLTRDDRRRVERIVRTARIAEA